MPHRCKTDVYCLFQGGYCLKSLAEGLAMSLRALLDDPVPEIGPLDPPCDR